MTEGLGVRTEALNIDQTLGFLIENVTILDSGYGDWVIDRSANTIIRGVTCHKQPDSFSDNGVIASCVTNFIFQDSTFNECRHVFTTGATQVGQIRYNGTKNLVVENVVGNHGGNEAGDNFVVFDNHPECSDMIFRNCIARLGDQESSVGFACRGPWTRFEGCQTYHPDKGTTPRNTQYGLQLKSANNTVERCRFEGPWQGNFITTSGSLFFGSQRFYGNEYVKCESVGIAWRDQAAITNNEIVGNVFRESGTFDNAGSPNIPKCLIQVGSGNGHFIRGNHLDKRFGETHDFSIDFKDVDTGDINLEGNYTTGYGSGVLGVTGTNAAAIQSDWGAENYTDGS